MTEHRTPSRRPVAPFDRAEAIYFLASAGAFLQHVGAPPENSSYAAGAVVEALLTIGVSQQELRIATAKGFMGAGSRWDSILRPDFLETTKDGSNDHAGS
jgi:hypothetical protein